LLIKLRMIADDPKGGEPKLLAKESHDVLDEEMN